MNTPKKLPKFKYYPGFYNSEDICTEPQVCDCCKQNTEASVFGMYSEQEVRYICVDCVASGKATATFDGTFVQDAEGGVSDPDLIDELFSRTPGYSSWQGEYWRSCCGDFCAYLGNVGEEELDEMGILDEVYENYEEEGGNAYDLEGLSTVDSPTGYLFRCLHCGRYRLWVDMD